MIAKQTFLLSFDIYFFLNTQKPNLLIFYCYVVKKIKNSELSKYILYNFLNLPIKGLFFTIQGNYLALILMKFRYNVAESELKGVNDKLYFLNISLV